MKKLLGNGGFTLVELLNVVVILIVIASFFFGIFVTPDVAVRACDKHGFSDITVTDKEWFFVGFRGCGWGDAAKFKVTAKNPVGKSVKVFVCTGWILKGATIRTD